MYFLQKFWYKLSKLSLIFVLTISIIPRAVNLLINNFIFGSEQGIDYLITKNIVIDHKLVLTGYEVGGIGGFSKGPGWNYFLAIPFFVFSGDPTGGMILMFLLGLMSIVITYLFLMRAFDKSVAIIASLLLAISPAFIDYSRLIWPPYSAPVFITLVLFYMYRVFKGKSSNLINVFILIAVLGHIEMATAGLLSLQMIFIVPFLFKKKFVSLRHVSLSIVAFFCVLSPLLIFDLLHNFTNTKGLLGLIPRGGWYIFSFTNHINNLVSTFSWTYMYTFTPHRIGWVLFLTVTIIGSILYLKEKKEQRENKLFILFLLTSPIFFFIFLIIYPGNISSWWLINLQVYYCYLFAVTYRVYKKNNFLKFVYILMIIAMLKSFSVKTQLLYKNETHNPPIYSIKFKREVYDYVYSDSYHPTIVRLSKYNAQQDYEYMQWLYESKSYQNKGKESKYIYLLIEPQQYEKITTSSFGKKNLVYKKTFTSGYIVEKYGL